VLERATEPFFTTKKRGVGTGLGLSQVVGIVKSHGGHFFLESEVGKGTKAIIYLPAIREFLEEDGSSSEPETEMPVEGEVVPSRPPSKGTAMVVDDEKDIRLFLSLILEEEGFTVYPSSNGEDAFELYNRLGGQVDLVITDLVMPKMGGKELIEKLKQRDPQLPIIAVSGYASAGSFEEVDLWERVWFLSKPITKKDLLTVIGQIVAKEG